MPRLAAFRAIRYAPEVAGDLARVVSPPYDIISEPEREVLEASSPYNAVRLVLPRGEGEARYPAAARLFSSWLEEGVLAPDERESITLYEQRTLLAGERRAQRGVVAAVGLDPPEEGGVLPHERTYADIVGDRLSLMRATQANLEPILCVYEGADAAAHEAQERITQGPPLVRFTTPDGVEHLVWRVDDGAAVAAVTSAAEEASVVIADGHHRWRTAMRYRDERRESDGPGPWDAQMMMLVDASRFGPALRPIHRTVTGIDVEQALERCRTVMTVEPAAATDPEALVDELAERRAHGRTFAMHDGGRAWWLRVTDATAEREALPPGRSAAWRDLDVAVLHALVLDRLLGGVDTGFAHSSTEAVEQVRAGRAAFAVLLAPPPFEAVRAVAEAGDSMPQKSTLFLPKPATGVVMRGLGGSAMG